MLKERNDISVHGFALMPNHYHLMTGAPSGCVMRDETGAVCDTRLLDALEVVAS